MFWIIISHRSLSAYSCDWIMFWHEDFMFVKLIPSIFYTGQPAPLNINSWCRGDYKELLPGRYLNGRTSEILCHDRETGLSLSYLLGYWLVHRWLIGIISWRFPEQTQTCDYREADLPVCNSDKLIIICQNYSLSKTNITINNQFFMIFVIESRWIHWITWIQLILKKNV